MNLLQPWNLVFLVGFVVYTAIRGVFASRTRINQQAVNRIDVTDRLLLALVLITNLLLPVVYLLTPLLDFANYRPPTICPWIGAGLMVLALWFFWRTHADLGLNWSATVELRKGHELVRHGVYRRIRHPMYAAIFSFALAQALLLPNWLAGWTGILTFALLYFVRVGREEQMMVEQFGPEYREYMRQTGRLFPRIFAPRD